MGNIILIKSMMLSLLFASCLLGFSNNVMADDGVRSDATSDRHKVEYIRDKDYKCIQCHKDSKQTLAGSHGEGVMQKLGKEANCTDCHGNIGPDHRDGASTVTKFSDAQSQAGTGKTHLSTDAILQANNTCMDCHSSENLREASWTHDVHAKNLTCSNCHTLHATDAKVLSYERKQLVNMCVDCHSDFNQTREEKE
ncbi:cytochrome c-type protein nrfB precursor [Vibrio ishigakensis]|uniref:Cytochrome c-type protein nrfB n=1 Tax=Vibrio ishigakensis TaxID=1481914 RepID=A0A0B8Q5Y7_9VIBR|nr:cytochrome c-type protein nrfB precursor [Vibrio ishigakensis]